VKKADVLRAFLMGEVRRGKAIFNRAASFTADRAGFEYSQE
jgi:hypothetical protein